MKARTVLSVVFSILLLALVPMTAMADSITPDTFSATLTEGSSITITKTVTVDDAPPIDAPVDVYFLTDSTGSMYYDIAAVKASAAAILADTAGLGEVNWGVGEYRDFGDYFTYRTNTAITSDTSAVQAGINMWSAGGGGDWQEANLYALYNVATGTEEGWRSDSTKILVWFGDAPGHDPSGGVTEAAATSALVAANISVEAIDVGSLDYYGQASRVAAATGGHYYSGVSSSDIVDVITDSISTALIDYNSVALNVSGAPAGVGVDVTPLGYVGDYDRGETRTFEFDVTFTGDAVGVYDFEIAALVDGGAVAWECDSITVEPIPEPMTLFLLGSGLAGLAGCRRRKKA